MRTITLLLLRTFLFLISCGITRAEYPYGYSGRIPAREFNVVDMLLQSDLVVIARPLPSFTNSGKSVYFEVEEILYPAALSLQENGRNYFANLPPENPGEPFRYVGHANLHNVMADASAWPFHRLYASHLIHNVRYILFLKQDRDNTDMWVRRLFNEKIVLPEQAF
jgi:hypothetical protein